MLPDVVDGPLAKMPQTSVNYGLPAACWDGARLQAVARYSVDCMEIEETTLDDKSGTNQHGVGLTEPE